MSDERARGAAREARLDRAIDGAVREILDVEPRADLRARVMARLPVSGVRLPASGSRLGARVEAAFSRNRWVVLPLTAAAVLVLAVFVARRSEPVVPQTTVATAQRADVRLPAPVVAVAVPVSRGSVASARVANTSAAPSRTIAAAVVAEDSTAAVAIDPLKSIAPITIAPIAQDSIAAADITVRALSPINEVQVAPLTPPDRRN